MHSPKWGDNERPLLKYRSKPTQEQRQHYECVISMCAHDAPDLLDFQIQNILKYVPNCMIVLHINSNTIQLDENTLPSNVWINPSAYKSNTLHRSLWLAFLSNVIYGSDVATFDRIIFFSSSCLFYRRIDWTKYPKNAVATATDFMDLHAPRGDWWWWAGRCDSTLIRYARSKGQSRIYGGPFLSGVMMPSCLLPELVAISELHIDHPNIAYPYEEFYPQTVANYYANATGAPIFPTLVWAGQGHERYLLLVESCFEDAAADKDKYAICRVLHDMQCDQFKRVVRFINDMENAD